MQNPLTDGWPLGDCGPKHMGSEEFRTDFFPSTFIMSLQINVTPQRTFGQVVTLHGSLDNEGAPRLKQELEQLIAAESPLIVLELAGLTYVNSQGLRVLQTAIRTLERTGGELKLLNPSETLSRVFEIIAMPTLTEKFAGLDELDTFLHETQTRDTPPAPDAKG